MTSIVCCAHGHNSAINITGNKLVSDWLEQRLTLIKVQEKSVHATKGHLCGFVLFCFCHFTCEWDHLYMTLFAWLIWLTTMTSDFIYVDAYDNISYSFDRGHSNSLCTFPFIIIQKTFSVLRTVGVNYE